MSTYIWGYKSDQGFFVGLYGNRKEAIEYCKYRNIDIDRLELRKRTKPEADSNMETLMLAGC